MAENNFAKSSARIAYNPWIISLSTLNGLKKLLPAAEFIPAADAGRLLSPKPVKVFTHQKNLPDRFPKTNWRNSPPISKNAGLTLFSLLRPPVHHGC